MDLSIIIVNFKSSDFLARCLKSLRRTENTLSLETWVVENGSGESLEDLRREFPHVHWIVNPRNLGFSRAANQAVRLASGRHCLFLNPDAEVGPGALQRMVAFLDQNSEVGIVGGKILNPDGSLERACRRSIPTPDVAFFRLSGLSLLFPDDPVLGQYNLTHLDPNRAGTVGAVSGSCMMVRHQALKEVGMLDEGFFLYGEDLDLCHRAGLAGWKIYYLPEAQITHFKGGSTQRNRTRSHYEFHRAMAIFHRKHFASSTRAPLNWLIYFSIWCRALVTWPLAFLRGTR